jgi:hypothetical protein
MVAKIAGQVGSSSRILSHRLTMTAHRFMRLLAESNFSNSRLRVTPGAGWWLSQLFLLLFPAGLKGQDPGDKESHQ